MIRMVPYFDIQYSPVTYPVYCLLFAAEAWGSGNDRIYKINVNEMDELTGEAQREYFDKEIRVHPLSRCFPGDAEAAFQEMKSRPAYPTFTEAIEEFKVWLKENGFPEGESEIFVKIWW